MRNRTLAVLGSLLLLPSLVSSQQVSVAAGYTSMPGRLGHVRSDNGPALRVGVDLLGGRVLTWTLEGGVDRLNAVRDETTLSCIVQGGATDTCTFTSRQRDTGLSLASIFRLHLGTGPVRPYLLAGFGYLRVRSPYREETFDSGGNLLPNFSGAGVQGDDTLQGHLGGGLLIQPGGQGIGVTVEGRATSVFSNYSGGLQQNWSPALLVGLRFRL